MRYSATVRYYVVANDGQKYGPADIDLLNEWIRDGRLTPDQVLEEDATGRQVPATDVPGLRFPEMSSTSVFREPEPTVHTGYGGGPHSSTPNYSNPPTMEGYYRPGPARQGDDGSSEMTTAWIYGAIGLLCCFVFAIFGISSANKAKAKGNPGGQAALIFNWVVLGIWALSLIVGILFGVAGAMMGM
jgi:hypothetical protein